MRIAPGRVFLSYAREDAATAERLYTDIKAHGLDPWIDSQDMLPGAKWKSAIRAAISESEFFVAIMSGTSVQKRGFVQRELHQALELLLEHPENRIFVVPVRIDECTPSHDLLLELNWLDLFPSYSEGLQRLLRALKVQPQTPAPQRKLAPKYPARVVFLTADFLTQIAGHLKIPSTLAVPTKPALYRVLRARRDKNFAEFAAVVREDLAYVVPERMPAETLHFETFNGQRVARVVLLAGTHAGKEVWVYAWDTPGQHDNLREIST